MNIFETIYTERLIIRKLEKNDSDVLFKYRTLPSVYEFQSFRPESEKDIQNFFDLLADSFDVNGTWFQLAICIKNSGIMIGDIGIHFLNDGFQVEIGYTVCPEYQKNGYALEAVHSVLNYIFTKLDKHRIAASVDPYNIKSIKLLEKIGMRKEAHFIKSFRVGDLWMDDCVYAILREEWI